MDAVLCDDRKCALGEGPFWHPARRELFWFDILNRKLLSESGEWQLDHAASAAGWMDQDTLLVASKRGLERFSLNDGTLHLIQPVEADNPKVRSNDGRTDRQGGFWFSTMGWNAERGAGSIYRHYDGEVRRLHGNITIPNAICFSPDGAMAYFADTAQRKVFRQELNAKTGWPTGDAEPHLDFSNSEKNPDGAITDADGNMWIAMWGGSELLCFSADGDPIKRIELPTPHVTCPAAGGPDGRDLYVTSATYGLPTDASDPVNAAGKTFVIRNAVRGLPDVPVRLAAADDRTAKT